MEAHQHHQLAIPVCFLFYSLKRQEKKNTGETLAERTHCKLDGEASWSILIR